jgi:hypothetical protein
MNLWMYKSVVLIERPPDDGPVRTETYVGVVLTKIIVTLNVH